MDTITEIAARHRFSVEAVTDLLGALRSGGGTMAQFSHPELGGMGQWSPGMLMIGDLSNASLKARVLALCEELSGLAVPGRAADESIDPLREARPFDNIVWWPESLGAPSSSGAQNQVRYAYFPVTSRLVIERSGNVTIYDTDNYEIHGVSQSQGKSESLVFKSQLGPVSLDELKQVQV